METKLNVKRVNRMLTMMLADMKDLDDEGRDLPIRWNIMHMYSASQLAKLLAMKRGLDLEVVSLAAVLHDIGVVVTKKKELHAENSELYVRKMIRKYNDANEKKELGIAKEEENTIVKMILPHSDKETITNDPYIEFMKDVDSLDRYLHGVKSEGAYLERCKKVLKELSIPIEE